MDRRTWKEPVDERIVAEGVFLEHRGVLRITNGAGLLVAAHAGTLWITEEGDRRDIVVTNGRVRAGYRIGELLFGGLDPDVLAAIVHVIGERPGNGHHTFSAYVTRLPARLWARRGVVDHNHTKVICNIADTALDPVLAAQQTAALLLQTMTG